MRFAFVCEVLAAVCEGGEVQIDRRRFYRLDMNPELRDEAAEALRVLRKLGTGEPQALERIAAALERIQKDGVLQMRDVERAEVYGKHLGERLRKKGKKR